jgi:hypothetical protein
VVAGDAGVGRGGSAGRRGAIGVGWTAVCGSRGAIGCPDPLAAGVGADDGGAACVGVDGVAVDGVVGVGVGVGVSRGCNCGGGVA